MALELTPLREVERERESGDDPGDWSASKGAENASKEVSTRWDMYAVAYDSFTTSLVDV